MIDIKELKAAFRALGFQVKKAEIRRMMQDVDKETSATVLFDDFVEMATPKLQSRDTREEIMKVFALFDDDSTGAISFRNLKRVANELGARPASSGSAPRSTGLDSPWTDAAAARRIVRGRAAAATRPRRGSPSGRVAAPPRPGRG